MRTRVPAIVISALVLTTGCLRLAGDLPGQEKLSGTGTSYTFFADGKPTCLLLLPEKPEPEEREAAQLIADSFKAMCGTAPPIVTGGQKTDASLAIHVGRTPLALAQVILPEGLDADGFVIEPVDAQRLVLLGARSVSTYYAATELLERYAGILWVWPGEGGTVLPKRKNLTVTVRRQVSEPAFRARKFSGISDAKMKYYRIHQRPREIRSRFHHNIHPVLKAKTYWDKHPEYFSLVGGTRRKPTPNRSNWQACTSTPEVVTIFAEEAKKRFRATPWITSFSVSQNDGRGFCECPNCRALDLPSVPGISDRYYTFVNAVADQIRDEFPGYRITCLAYSEATRDVPKQVVLRPNTMIYAVIPTLRDVHQDIRGWSKAAPALGAYFWLHGKAVPKFYPRRFAEYLRFMRKNHVREVYAEVYQKSPKRLASWELDGPRVWITAKLLWNPDADTGALTERFCAGFYGPGAEPMVRYYQRCEKAWDRREDVFDFGAKWRDLEFEAYTSADMDVLEGCLAEALALTQRAPEAHARLLRQRDALAKVAGHVRLMGLPDSLAKLPLGNEDDARQLVKALGEACRRSDELATQGMSLVGGLPPVAEQAADLRCAEISQLLGGKAIEFWQEIGNAPELRRFADPQLHALRGSAPNLLPNPGFETRAKTADTTAEALNWDSLDAPGWSKWVRPGTPGGVAVDRTVARGGKHSLVLSGVEAACGIFSCPAKPGERFRVVCWAKTTVAPVAGKARLGGKLTAKWQTADGKWFEGPPAAILGLAAGTSEWAKLERIVTIPAGAGKLVVLLGADKQHADEKTWFDDITVQRVHQP